MSYPKVIQVEPTNRCNFDCIMCIRRSWSEVEFTDMNLDLYRKIVDESRGKITRLDLYGFGEPLCHPRFSDMVKYAREGLGSEVELLTVTNGSLLTPEVSEKIVRYGMNTIVFSIDTIDPKKLEEIRGASEPINVIRNLTYLSKAKNKYDLKLGISTVLMRSNYMDLPEIVRFAGENGLDFVFVSHVEVYSDFIMKLAAYSTVSKEAYNEVVDILPQWPEITRNAAYELLIWAYTGSFTARYYKLLKERWERVSRRGYALNFPLLMEAMNLIPLIESIKSKFDEAASIAKDYGVELDLPKIFPDAMDRVCPYMDKEAMIITVSGDVSPCMEFAYTHPLIVNNHYKLVKKVSFGNVSEEPLEKIWNRPEYVEFRSIRKDLPRRMPWCGDCPYSTRECWYTRSTDFDCFGNTNSCNECLYSARITRCLI